MWPPLHCLQTRRLRYHRATEMPSTRVSTAGCADARQTTKTSVALGVRTGLNGSRTARLGKEVLTEPRNPRPQVPALL